MLGFFFPNMKLSPIIGPGNGEKVQLFLVGFEKMLPPPRGLESQTNRKKPEIVLYQAIWSWVVFEVTPPSTPQLKNGDFTLSLQPGKRKSSRGLEKK